MSEAEKRALPTIDVDPAAFERTEGHSPFNTGQRVFKYKPQQLRDREKSRTPRTAFFEEKLLWLSENFDGDVPYAFRVQGGAIRSLDAGCLGFLYNQQEPELVFKLDANGFISKVRPRASIKKRLLAAQSPAVRSSPGYTTEELSTAGLKPTLELLIRAAQQGGLVSYGQIAAHLEKCLGKSRISPRHMGYVAGPLMDAILGIDADAPLINLLVVRGTNQQPGNGATPYLRRHFGIRGPLSPNRRRHYVQVGLNEVWSYKQWPAVYHRLFGERLEALRDVDRSEFDDDGQGDNPKFGGQPESPEHKALKQYVLEHPESLKLRLKRPAASPERRLLSGDKMDVEFVEGARRIGVEVKSIRSGWEDLRRGVYQCVKYEAVMVAQSGLRPTEAQCEAVLVTERPLPSDLKALATKLGVRSRVVRVN